MLISARLMRPFTGWLAASAAILLTLASGTAQAEIRIKDVLGRSIMLEEPAQRVILGFYFEDYIAITGPTAIDRLAGISLAYWKGYRPLQYAAYLKAFPKIADLMDIGDADNGTMSAEKIVSARPDVVILSAAQFDYLGAAAEKIEATGIPIVVVDYNAQTVEKHVASTLIIGKVMGSEDRARRLANEYKAAIDDTLRRVNSAAATTKPKVYVELGQKGPDEYGNSYGNGMWAGVIQHAGGHNIASGKISNWGPLDPEYVVSSRPDIIIITGSEWMSMPNALVMGFGVDASLTQERLRPFLQRPGWADLPAVKTGHVYAIYHGGTRTICDYVYLRYIAKIHYPEAFKDVDPHAELVRYYEAYLPIKPRGSFMQRLDPQP